MVLTRAFVQKAFRSMRSQLPDNTIEIFHTRSGRTYTAIRSTYDEEQELYVEGDSEGAQGVFRLVTTQLGDTPSEHPDRIMTGDEIVVKNGQEEKAYKAGMVRFDSLEATMRVDYEDRYGDGR